MSLVGSWFDLWMTSAADGAQLSNSVAATSLLPAAAKFSLPANTLKVGSVLRITAAGRVSCVVTTPGTLTLDVRFNATPITVFSSGAMNLNIVAKTNVTWLYSALLQVRTIGAATAATLLGCGTWSSEGAVGAAAAGAGGIGAMPLPASAPAVGTGFDSTVVNVIDFFGTFSVATNPTNMTCHQFMVEHLASS